MQTEDHTTVRVTGTTINYLRTYARVIEIAGESSC